MSSSLASAPELCSARQQGLLELLAQVPDPRDPRGVRHPIAAVLGVAIAAVMAGARSFTAMGEWAADCDAAVLAQFGVTTRVPDEATIRRLFYRLDADALDEVIGTWRWARTAVVDTRRVIALDGKSVRGARTGDGLIPHLVAALDQHSGTVLGQVAVTTKSNEIPQCEPCWLHLI